MARGRADLWDAEIARAADGAEIPVEKLTAVFHGAYVGAPPGPWSEAEILKVLGRLLVLAAEELEGAAAAASHLDTARGGLLGLAQVASLLEVPRLADWSARLAESGELSELASDAARMLRGEAFEMVYTQSLIELRECAWRWPEAREVLPVELPAPVVVETEPEAESEPEAGAVVEPEAVAVTAEPESEQEPEPAPEPPPRVTARKRLAERALVADPSAIAAAFLARLLRSRGIAVTMAESAERAAAEIGGGGYDVAFVGAEWVVRESAGEMLIVKLLPEGGNPPAGLGERVLFKPPAAEEVNEILEAWFGRDTRLSR
jgi:hypothetical protein